MKTCTKILLSTIALIGSVSMSFMPKTTQASIIIFEDEFDTSASPWTLTTGNTVFKSGDHANAAINTSGTADHSGVHFDADGNEIATTNLHYAALNAGQNALASISTTVNLVAGDTYNVYFRYAGALQQQTARGTLTLGAESATTGTLTSSTTFYKTGTFSFTPTTTGSATLTLENPTIVANSDLLIDSVVVTSNIPEPSALALLAMGGLCFLRRRRSA